MPGCGGFIDISTAAKAVIFVGTFTTGGLETRVVAGRGPGGSPALAIAREGRHRKFRAAIGEKTFAGASGRGRAILYVTERCVLRLVEVAEDQGGGRGGRAGGGLPPHQHAATTTATTTALEVVELAPGVDLERDVLAHMQFRPRVAARLGVMDRRCFECEAGG